MQKNLLQDIVAYKKTSALFAAIQLGLFEIAKKYDILSNDICIKQGWNNSYFEMFCTYLEGEGYLERVEKGWKVNIELQKKIDDIEMICKHESCLYHKWLSPDYIVLSIKSAKGNRPYDIEGFNFIEQIQYYNVMYGNNINIIVFYFLRRMRYCNESNIRFLEYGRSNGKIGEILKKYIPKAEIQSTTFENLQKIEKSYDIIFIYNTIHYYSLDDWKSNINILMDILDEEGVICIVDIFYEKERDFQSVVLLDWITHGGDCFLEYEDICMLFFEFECVNIEKQYIELLNMDLIFIFKDKS